MFKTSTEYNIGRSLYRAVLRGVRKTVDFWIKNGGLKWYEEPYDA